MTAPVTIALYQNHRDNTPATASVSWDELTELLTTIERTACNPCKGRECLHKFGPAWSPVEIQGTRASGNVSAVTVAVFDLDHLTPQALEAVAERIEGYQYIIHTTHSHNPGAGDLCLRLVIALSAPVPAAQWRGFLARVIAHLALPCDPTCKDLARLYFLPSAPEGAESLTETGEGRPLDVSAILALPASRGTPAPALAALAPIPALPDTDAPIDLVAIYSRLRDVRNTYVRNGDTERATLLGRVIKGDKLATPGNAPAEQNYLQGRDPAVHSAASILGAALPVGTPEGVAIEIMRKSIGAMDCEPEGVNAWLDKVAFSYRRAMERHADADARRDAVNEKLRAGIVNRSVNRIARGDSAATDTTSEQAQSTDGDASEEDPAEAAWTKLLLWQPITKDGQTPRLIQCTHNAEIILQNCPEWRGVLRFNEVSKTVEIQDSPIVDVHANTLPIAVTNWLQVEWDLHLHSSAVEAVVLLVARKNRFDPLREYLNDLRWDGRPRADNFLRDYCGARLTDALGQDISEHITRISRRWLISAVARGLNPGCKVDTVLVLEGVQGIHKTSALEALGGPFFAGTSIDVNDKDTKMLAARSWIVELGELAAVRKSESGALKKFFTDRVDQFRPPYGHVIEDFPRRCVFVITTNEQTYLQDRSGNRRYWVLTCVRIAITDLIRDRDQLWAEAVALYRAADGCPECAKALFNRCPLHKWWLSDQEAADAEQQADDRVDLPANMIAAIGTWWFGKEPKTRPVFVRACDAAAQAMMLSTDRVTKAIEMDAGEALRKLGFARERRRLNGVRTWVYVPTERLRTAAKQVRGQEHLQVVETINQKDAGT